MRRRIVPAIAMVLAALIVPVAPAVRAQDVDPAGLVPDGLLPADTRIISVIRNDLDGDRLDDLVVLYSRETLIDAPARAGLMVVWGGAGQPRPVHLFGPPTDLRQEPTLRPWRPADRLPRSSTDLGIRDLLGNGHSFIVLKVSHDVHHPTEHHQVWVFDRDPAPDDGPPAEAVHDRPPWHGTGFRLAAFVEGSTVEVIPAPAGGPAMLRRQEIASDLGGTGASVTRAETYTWRDNGFRLAKRSLALPPDADVGGSPVSAVLGFYAAVGRGDLRAATDLLGDDLRAGRSSTLLVDPSAPERALRVEELRHVSSPQHRPAANGSEQTLYVRASIAEPGGPTGQPTGRHSFAGTWRVRAEGGRWRLVRADLRETVDLSAVADRLPSGTTVVQTASGDLRGSGADDVVALASAPGTFSTLDPYVFFVGPNGLGPALRAGSFLQEDVQLGAHGSLLVEDVTGDARTEIVVSAVVGAHSAVLWILSWDGSTLAPLFARGSNSPVIDLTHLDGDRIPEIVLIQSGYCGGYASSPRMVFAFRLDGGAYRSATARYPSLNADLAANVADLQQAGGSGPVGERACVQHMLALAHAFADRPAETRTAYRAYAELRRQLAPDEASYVRPAYLGAPYVADDLRAAIDAAGAGRGAAWSPAELAVLYDLLGDALTSQAASLESKAERADERQAFADAQAARREAVEAALAAERAYRQALALDPTDDAARSALGD